jgi:hypothetical protein
VVQPLPGHGAAPIKGLARSPRAFRLRLTSAFTLPFLTTLALALLATTAPAGLASSARPPGSAPAILITTYRLAPKVQRTVGFTGYATYSFSTRPKRRIVSATARIVGAQAHAVRIGGTSVSRNRKRFTVKLVFPGEQGNPGKLVVRLGTVGA